MPEALHIYGGADGTTNTTHKQYDIYTVRKMIEWYLAKELVFEQFANPENLYKNHGKNFKVHKFVNILSDENTSTHGTDVDGNPITTGNLYGSSRSIATILAKLPKLKEGVLNSNLVQMVSKEVTASVEKYAVGMMFSEDIIIFDEKGNLIPSFQRGLVHLAQQIIDDIHQTIMMQSTNVAYTGGATSLQTVGTGLSADGSKDNLFEFNPDVFSSIVAKMKKEGVKKFVPPAYGSTRVGTAPIRDGVIAIVPSEVIEHDLRKYSKNPSNTTRHTFVDKSEYPNGEKAMLNNEVGRFNGTIIVENPRAIHEDGASEPASYVGSLATNGGKVSVATTVVLTQDAYSSIGVTGFSKMDLNVVMPKPQTSDIHGTVGGISIKFFLGGLIVHDEKIVCMKHTFKNL